MAKYDMTHKVKMHYPVCQYGFMEVEVSVRSVGDNPEDLKKSQQYISTNAVEKFFEDNSQTIKKINETYGSIIDIGIGK